MRIRLTILLVYTALIFAGQFLPSLSYAQEKYGFDFSKNWEWEDIISKLVDSDRSLLSSVDILRKQITIEEARIIFYEVSRLNDAGEIRELGTVAGNDPDYNASKWQERINSEFKSFAPDNDFSGLMNTVIKLAKIRTPPDPGAPSFRERTYLTQPVRNKDVNLTITFNYAGVDNALNYLKGDGSAESLEAVLKSEPYLLMMQNQKLERIDEETLVKMFENSYQTQPLYNIYKWLNPSSFRSLGGVSIFERDFENVVSSIKDNESNIKQAVKEQLADYIPENLFLTSELMPVFGSGEPGWVEKNKLGISLEYPGDDYIYLQNLISRIIYRQAQEELQLPVYELFVKKEDTKLLEIMKNVMITGTANHVGPLGTETRPSSLLEKDFAIFNKTFKQMYSGRSKMMTDSLIREGYRGVAPFYTMGTQMAYIIESVHGKKGLVEAIMSGPVYFFTKYIDSYEQSSAKIRKPFRFSKTFEKKIASMKDLVPDDVFKYAIVLNRNRTDQSLIDNEINGLFNEFKASEKQEMLHLISGELYLFSGQLEKAKEHFMAGINGSSLKSRNAGLIGDFFFKAGANNEAIEFYNIAVNAAPGDGTLLEKRGIYYYITGDTEGAKADLEKAVSTDPSLTTARILLSRIN